MFTIKKINSSLSKEVLINLFIALIPLSFLIGNLAINLNILMICVLGIMIYGFQIFEINEKIYKYLIYSFFIYIILITLFRNLPNLAINLEYQKNIFKSFFFLRFLVLFLVINKLLEFKKINISLFYFSSAFCSFFLGLDIVIQLIFGKDIFGVLPMVEKAYNGFFGEEKVAGSFLQKFSIFFIIYIRLFLLTADIKKNFYMILSFLIFLVIIYFTNNKFPLIIYAFSCLFYFAAEFFIIKKKNYFVFIFLLFPIIFLSLYKTNSFNFNAKLTSFYGNARYIVINIPKLFYHGEESFNEPRQIGVGSGHMPIYNQTVNLWYKNKVLGSGLRSIRINCKQNPKIKSGDRPGRNGMNQMCAPHPHNYTLELLLDLGIIGFVLIYLIFILFSIRFIKFFMSRSKQNLKILGIPFFLILFFEFFPIKSSGSFFSTGNATIIFFMFPFLKNISNLKFIKKLL